MKDVLRLQIGEKIILGDGKGIEAEVTLEKIAKNKIIGRINKNVSARTPLAGRTVNLYLAILKKENFELVVQKAVEVGVSNIIPIITERTIKTGLNIERLKKIILEASEQSGRSIVPTLSPILDFKDALKQGTGIIFHLGAEDYLPDKNAKEVSIFVGPEGGFTEKEVDLAKSSGYTVASLGPLTLRSETAAIIATYRVVSGI